MGQVRSYYLDHLEWEILQNEQEITHITFTNGLYKLNKDCVIRFERDSQYNIIATISGIAEHHTHLEPNFDKSKGSFVPHEVIVGYSPANDYKYTLHGIVIGKHSLSPIAIGSTASRFHAELIVYKIEKEINHAGNPTETLQEWYISGEPNVAYTRSTKRSLDESYRRIREGIDPKEKTLALKGQGSSADFILIKLADTSFIISKVPKEYGPEWAYKLSIEYRKSFGKIPSNEERQAISELVGFILGNQLQKIGETNYDNGYSINSQVYHSPPEDNVISKCERSCPPPVEIGYSTHRRGMVEPLITQLLPKYIELRDKLHLKDALLKYWIAKYSSIGINLPVLSSAVETLAEQVLKSHPEVKHYYIEYKSFNELIKDELSSINSKLEGKEFKDKILNKIKGASQRGANEKLEMMFEIIGLPIGKIERDAIKARNKMAHSSLGEISDEEAKEVVRHTRAYETLFSRIILKILSYNDEYTDYYTFGHPSRKIDDPIPDPTPVSQAPNSPSSAKL